MSSRRLNHLAQELFVKSDDAILDMFPVCLESRIESRVGFVERGRVVDGFHSGKIVRVKHVTKGVSCGEIEAMLHAKGVSVPELYAFSPRYMVIEDVGSLTLEGWHSMAQRKANTLGGDRPGFLSKQGSKMSAVLHKAFVQLDMLHKRGIYHLDISADNIVLCFPKSEDALEVAVEDIRVYIIDFGSARFASGIDLEAEPLTVTVPVGGELVRQPARVHSTEFDTFSLFARTLHSMNLGDGRINGIIHDRFAFGTVAAQVFDAPLGIWRQLKSRPSDMPLGLYRLAKQLTSPDATIRLSPEANLHYHAWAKVEEAKRDGRFGGENEEEIVRTNPLWGLETLAQAIKRRTLKANTKKKCNPWILANMTGRVATVSVADYGNEETALIPPPQVGDSIGEGDERGVTDNKNKRYCTEPWIGPTAIDYTPRATENTYFYSRDTREVENQRDGCGQVENARDTYGTGCRTHGRRLDRDFGGCAGKYRNRTGRRQDLAAVTVEMKHQVVARKNGRKTEVGLGVSAFKKSRIKSTAGDAAEKNARKTQAASVLRSAYGCPTSEVSSIKKEANGVGSSNDSRLRVWEARKGNGHVPLSKSNDVQEHDDSSNNDGALSPTICKVGCHQWNSIFLGNPDNLDEGVYAI